jgi:release factor glutamine methyltransferase
MRLGQEVQALPRAARLTSLTPTTSRAAALAALTQAMAGVTEAPAREAALILRAGADLKPTDLIASPEAPLGVAATKVEAYAARRAAGEPLSRILGRREFWSLSFALTPDTLDPRPETETVVEAALAAFAARRGEALRLIDFGVGSGALIAALLSEFPAAQGVGVDVSAAAAAQARANLAALGLAARADICVCDWGAGIEGRFDLIVANPPYIRSADIAGLTREVAEHDPRLALDGGPDGLDAYRALAPHVARLLAPGGWFFFEIGEGQAEEVKAIAGHAGLAATTTHNDLAGIARVIAGAR